jgi:2-methylfumaryl-CoA hydratase
MSKMAEGNFFEDFAVGRPLVHAVPRTVTTGDVALYLGLTGARHAVHCADGFAERCGHPRAPIDDLLTFHVVFGKSVPDVSLNAVANLGYAEGRFLAPVYPGDTLVARSEVVGVRENSNGRTGTVYVRTKGFRDGEPVLEYVRWVMVRKRDPAKPAPPAQVPELKPALEVEDLVVPAGLAAPDDPEGLAGARWRLEDYEVGERIDHVDGMTIEEAEHRIATRLYQNTARVHFDTYRERQGRFGKCIVYGGHVLSLARALAWSGLETVVAIAGINGGTHANPCFAGDTVYAWSEVLDRRHLPDRADLGALRLRLVATKDHPCADFPLKGEDGRYRGEVLLDFDYWALVPRA